MSEKPSSSAPADPENPITPDDDSVPTKPESAADQEPEPNNGTRPPDTPDLEGVRAASEISMSGGPQSSRAKWAWINLGIKLFKLTAKFFPALLLLGGLSLSYFYFVGAPPVVQKMKLNPVVQKVAATVGVELEVPKVDEETGEIVQPQGRLDQMLQQTRDVVAMSDQRVNTANAIADGGFDIDSAMDGIEMPGEEEGEPAAGETNGATETTTEALPEVDEARRLADYQDAVAAQGPMRTYSSGDSEWAAIAREEVVETETPLEKDAPRQVRDLDYTSFIRPSAEFRAWLRTVRIGSVMTGEEPKALINSMTFTPGSTVDYVLGVTFEGLAENDTLLVFRDRTGAVLTIQF